MRTNRKKNEEKIMKRKYELKHIRVWIRKEMSLSKATKNTSLHANSISNIRTIQEKKTRKRRSASKRYT